MAKKLLALFPTKKNEGCTNALHDLPGKYYILLPSDGLAPITFLTLKDCSDGLSTLRLQPKFLGWKVTKFP